jgi:hypothetical protein
MSASVLDKLAWRNFLENVDVPLENGEIGLLKTFQAYIYYRDSINDAIDSYEKWLSITLEQFQRFRISKEWFSISENTGKLITAPSSNTSHSRDPTAEFKRGIKRDISMFPTLKQDKQWDVWQRAIFAQARAQDLIEVLTASYVPVIPANRSLFEENESICTPFSNVHYYPMKERHSFVNIPSTMSLVSHTCDKYRYKQHTAKFVRVNLLRMINTCHFSFLVP